ncbi:hypothetical protein OHA70_03530 [Kribbella sp. NBC_00382]|uniref:hypothetical protein n=1 Tax=Kribbella sp. NBC_00382 TaxID=2975967 RepID=UPI002E1BE94D
MAGWESLQVDLRRLFEESPGAVVSGPHPDSERSERRIHIELAAWATDIAADLDAKYGDLVELKVGAMTFPAGELWTGEGWYQSPGAPAESVRLEVSALSPLSVRTGRFARTDVLVTNRASYRHVLSTNGDLFSAVIDDSGNVVGAYVGPHTAARVQFEIEPQQSRPVPVLIGTASMAPESGYAVPPGHWGLVVELDTANGHLLSAPLELTITP